MKAQFPQEVAAICDRINTLANETETTGWVGPEVIGWPGPEMTPELFMHIASAIVSDAFTHGDTLATDFTALMSREISAVMAVDTIKPDAAVDGLKSKEELFAALERIDGDHFAGCIAMGLEHPHIEDETFGLDSHIFVTVPGDDVGLDDRRTFESRLRDAGFRVDSEWTPRTPWAVDVQVQYFQGHNWDE